MLSAKNKVRIMTASVILVIAALVVSPVFAAYSLFGEASIVGGGNPGNAAQLVSDASPGYAGVDVPPASPIAWASLATLSTDYNVTDDDCGGGSPRMTLGIDTTADNVADGYVHIYIGPSPSFTGCTAGWQTTGNLIGNSDAGRYDYSQFGGSPYTTYSGAPASVLAGSVVEAYIVMDSGWMFLDGEQTILVDNINVNGDITTFDPILVGPPTTKDQCKNDGWMTFNTPRTFKNQGDCIQYVNTGK